MKLLLCIALSVLCISNIASAKEYDVILQEENCIEFLGDILRFIFDALIKLIKAIYEELPQQLKELVYRISEVIWKVIFPFVLNIVALIWSSLNELGKAIEVHLPDIVQQLTKLPMVVSKGRFFLTVKKIIYKIRDSVHELPEYIFQEVLATLNRRKDEVEKYVNLVIDLVTTSARGFVKRLKGAFEKLIRGENRMTLHRFIHICAMAPFVIANEFMNEIYDHYHHWKRLIHSAIPIGLDFTHHLTDDLVQTMIRGVGKIIDESISDENWKKLKYAFNSSIKSDIFDKTLAE